MFRRSALANFAHYLPTANKRIDMYRPYRFACFFIVGVILTIPLSAQEGAKPSDTEVLQKMMELVNDDFGVQVPAAEWLLALDDIDRPFRVVVG